MRIISLFVIVTTWFVVIASAGFVVSVSANSDFANAKLLANLTHEWQNHSKVLRFPGNNIDTNHLSQIDRFLISGQINTSGK